MKQMLSLLLALTMLMGHQGVEVPDSSQTEPIQTEEPGTLPIDPAEAAYADFSLDLLRASRKAGENTLLSPLSVTLALGMTAVGAAGETKREFADLFGMTPEELSPYCRGLIEKYADLGGSSQSNLANSLWCDPALTLNDSFVQTCQDDFDAELFHIDLQNPKAVRSINSWVSRATRGKIPSVLDRPLSDDVVLALINAVYFKNQFERPFDAPSRAWSMDFHNADGTVSQPHGMSNGRRRETYLSHEGGQGVILPYDDGKLGLLLMLPNEELSLTEYLSGWDGSTIAALLKAQTKTTVVLQVPKFKAEWSGELRDALMSLGLTRAFTFDQADFTPMGSSPLGPLFIASVIHKTAFEINEKGTEAAAVTVVAGAATAIPPDDLIRLTFDRPFVYGIVDLETGAPLFLGTLEQVESAR